MNSLEDVFGLRELAIKDSVSITQDIPKFKHTLRLSTKKIKRIDPLELELAYILDPVLFNGINLIVDLASPFELHAKDKTTRQDIQQFGEETNLDMLIPQMMTHSLVHGNGWLENIFNKNKTDIVDLDYSDPKRMDFQRDMNRNILLDETGKMPAGYIWVVELGHILPKHLEERITTIGAVRGVPIEADRISHFTYKSVGDGFEGIGLVEPLYKTSLRKSHIEEGFAQSVFRSGFPVWRAEVGDKDHEPNPQMVSNALKVLKGINYKSAISDYYYNKYIPIETRETFRLQEHMMFFVNQEVTGLGGPRALITGLSDETNRATLNVQNTVFENRLTFLRKRIELGFSTQVFKIMKKLRGWEEMPVFKWQEINTDDLDSRSKRFRFYAQAGIFADLDKKQLEKIRKKIFKDEGLDMDEMEDDDTGNGTA